MSPQDMRDRLIESTITVIANEGLDKTTTKAIASVTGINEAYIYRHFSHKEDLLAKAFEKLDIELASFLLQHITEIFDYTMIDRVTRYRKYFDKLWGLFMDNREYCLAFIRYYYSPYFSKYSIEAHRQRYAPFIEKFSSAFKEGADVWMILNHILNVMLDFAVKVHCGQMSEEDDYTEHIFRVVYCSVEQYFKENSESEC